MLELCEEEEEEMKLPDTITEEELIKILRKTKKPYHKIAFALGFYNCLRVSEVVKLTQDDIDKGRKLLFIKQAKGKKDRHIPIAKEVLRGLRHIPVKCGIRALQMAFNRYSKRALNKRLNFHLLRHSGITHYLTKKNWNAFQVQQLAGHSKISTTQIYTHINPTHLVEKMWET